MPPPPAAKLPECRGDYLEQIVTRGCSTRLGPHNSVELLHNGSNAFTALITDRRVAFWTA